MDVLMVSVLVQIHVHVTADGLDQHVLQVVKYMSIFIIYYTAICNNGCTNGVCTSPNSCTCNSGWTGPTCSTGMNVFIDQLVYANCLQLISVCMFIILQQQISMSVVLTMVDVITTVITLLDHTTVHVTVITS